MQIPKIPFFKNAKLPKPKMPSLFSRIGNYLTKIIGRLNAPQKLFFIVTLLWAFSETSRPLLCFIILIGLAMEFWPRFNTMWHSLLGKACLLFIYAIVANFALASAAGVVNDITGVAAEQLPYSHNLAILLYLPLWFIGFTFCALVLIQLVTPFYLIALLLLKPFGVRATKYLSQGYYPFTTSIIRMVLAALVASQVHDFNENELEVAGRQFEEIFSTDFIERDGGIGLGEINNDPQSDDFLTVSVSSLDNGAEKNKASAVAEDSQGIDAKETPDKSIKKDEKDKEKMLDIQYQKFIQASLQKFIYFLEADEYSRCEIKEGTRVIELNDFEILEITRVSKKLGSYRYQVKKCISPAIGLGDKVKPFHLAQ